MKNINAILKNETQKKILLFFNENPHCIDTAKGISVWVGCDTSAAKKALNKLVKEGVLINHRTASTDAYSYTNQRAIVKKIERCIKSL